jgi:hypothetical protein
MRALGGTRRQLLSCVLLVHLDLAPERRAWHVTIDNIPKAKCDPEIRPEQVRQRAHFPRGCEKRNRLPAGSRNAQSRTP